MFNSNNNNNIFGSQAGNINPNQGFGQYQRNTRTRGYNKQNNDSIWNMQSQPQQGPYTRPRDTAINRARSQFAASNNKIDSIWNSLQRGRGC